MLDPASSHTQPVKPKRHRRSSKTVRLFYARILRLILDNSRRVYVLGDDGQRETRHGILLPQMLPIASTLYAISTKTVRRAIRDLAADRLVTTEMVRDGRSTPPTTLLSIPHSSGDSHGRRG